MENVVTEQQHVGGAIKESLCTPPTHTKTGRGLCMGLPCPHPPLPKEWGVERLLGESDVVGDYEPRVFVVVQVL